MAFAAELEHEGKPLLKGLFLDSMTEKTQMLVDHVKHLHLGLALVANIGENVATVKLYDNYMVGLPKVTCYFVKLLGYRKTNYINCG